MGRDLGSQARSRVVTLRDEKTVQVFARGLVVGGRGLFDLELRISRL